MKCQSDRVAIVTGGAGAGLGSGISRSLGSSGWGVVIVDRDPTHANDILTELQEAGADAIFVPVDLTAEDGPRHCIETAVAWRGRLDGLVNSAGVGCVGELNDISDEALDRVIGVNLRAVFRLSREASEVITSPGGAIVNISSVHGMHPFPGFSAYALTKGGVQALTRALAVDLGPRGVRVNCVMPGMVDCLQTRDIMSQRVPDVEAYIKKWADTRQLLPWPVMSRDVGELVEFLLSDRSRGVTAQSIFVDAGSSTMLTDRDG